MKQIFSVGANDPTPLRLFAALSAIPRPSGSEGEIADYLVAFAQKNGLAVYRDAANNVLIRKNATKGREGEPPLLLQAHSDMVAEKNSGVTHDFSKDPIRLLRDGDLLMADGTTLGADDGFGIALILAALLEAPSHPALECLITSGEEVGMDGAMAFDYSLLRARRMLNLDSDAEREIILGCCGGLTTALTLPAKKAAPKGDALLLRISGLCGGHSGSDIHRGRGNALSLMAAWLTALEREMPFAIASLDGGDKSNAIPRECTALLILDDGKRAKEILQKTAEELRSTCKAPEDAGLCFAIEGVACKQSFAANETRRILRLLSLQTGVIVWRADGTPQLSRNVAAVHTDDNGLTLVLSVRSAEQGEIDFLRLEAETLAEELGAVCTHSGAYPGWESSADSALVRAWQQAAASEGINATPTVIHAGLECGLFSEKLPGLTAISVGCNIHDLHTPAERMELSSFARCYRILLDFLTTV